MTTTYTEIVNDIVTATARPDLVATGDIDLAIRRAVLKLHSMAFWPMDLAEVVVTFQDNTKLSQSIDVSANLPRFRAMKYMRENILNSMSANTAPTLDPYQVIGTGQYNTQAYFEKMEPDAILDAYELKKANVWYLGGSNINLNCRKPIGAVSIGYYQYPVVTAASFSSWIADAYPFAVIDECVRTIYANTGFGEMARHYDDICREHYVQLTNNFIDGEGR